MSSWVNTLRHWANTPHRTQVPYVPVIVHKYLNGHPPSPPAAPLNLNSRVNAIVDFPTQITADDTTAHTSRDPEQRDHRCARRALQPSGWDGGQCGCSAMPMHDIRKTPLQRTSLLRSQAGPPLPPRPPRPPGEARSSNFPTCSRARHHTATPKGHREPNTAPAVLPSSVSSATPTPTPNSSRNNWLQLPTVQQVLRPGKLACTSSVSIRTRRFFGRVGLISRLRC